LGSSDYGAQLAAHLGIPYVFAHFITDGEGAKQAIDLYRQQFRPSPRLQKPQVIVCLWAIAQEDSEQAYYHFRSRARWKIDRQRGILGAMQNPEHALDGLNSQDLAMYENMCQKGFVGDGPTVMRKITTLADELGIEEVALITWAYSFEIRKKSYEVLLKELS
jgi:alkanesulfonate monooxygenase SsuD/methylene tetrahydromethanopterin reductase-like flavin-dependent oxidoreductase (luciferase family)